MNREYCYVFFVLVIDMEVFFYKTDQPLQNMEEILDLSMRV